VSLYDPEQQSLGNGRANPMLTRARLVSSGSGYYAQCLSYHRVLRLVTSRPGGLCAEEIASAA